MKTFTRLPLVAAVLTAIAVVGCGGEGDPGSGSASASPRATQEVIVDKGVTETEISLGQHLKLSGDDGADNEQLVQAIEAYFRYVSEQGGICDRSVVLHAGDDKGSEESALAVATDLVEEDTVAAFVANQGSLTNTASAPYINDAEVPDLFVGAPSSPLADVEEYGWSTTFDPDFEMEGELLADWVNETFADEQVAILYPDSEDGTASRNGFASSASGDIVAEQTYPPGAASIDAELEALKNASPDLVFVHATSAQAARLYEYMSENDWTPRVVMSYAAAPTETAKLLGGDQGAAEGFAKLAGVITTKHLLEVTADAGNPAVKDHAKIMKDYTGPATSGPSIYGQALAEAVVHTLEIACENGDLTREGIMEAAESVVEFHPSLLVEGVDVTLGTEDHASIESLHIIEVLKDGKAKVLTEAPVGPEGEKD